ncbi:MAG: aconitate hydratase, partial [Synergistales bacterium]|nr:aconitate hydratase [Synergistales bacterium]
YLGVKAVIVKSFARIHLANLVNFGILPLVFEDRSDYDAIEDGDTLSLERDAVTTKGPVIVRNERSGHEIRCAVPLSEEDLDVIRAGGKLNWVKARKR